MSGDEALDLSDDDGNSSYEFDSDYEVDSDDGFAGGVIGDSSGTAFMTEIELGKRIHSSLLPRLLDSPQRQWTAPYRV